MKKQVSILLAERLHQKRCAVCGSHEGTEIVSYSLGLWLCKAHSRQVRRKLSGLLKADLAETVRKCRDRYVRKHGYGEAQ